jgi:hypothetical protein
LRQEESRKKKGRTMKEPPYERDSLNHNNVRFKKKPPDKEEVRSSARQEENQKLLMRPKKYWISLCHGSKEESC